MPALVSFDMPDCVQPLSMPPIVQIQTLRPKRGKDALVTAGRVRGCRGDHTGGSCGAGRVSGKVTVSFRRADCFVHCCTSGAPSKACDRGALNTLDKRGDGVTWPGFILRAPELGELGLGLGCLAWAWNNIGTQLLHPHPAIELGLSKWELGPILSGA